MTPKNVSRLPKNIRLFLVMRKAKVGAAKLAAELGCAPTTLGKVLDPYATIRSDTVERITSIAIAMMPDAP